MLDYETIRNFAKEVIANHDWERMEAILYTDGDFWIRQRGSTGTHEDKIMVTIPLGISYWSEAYFWGEDLEKNQELKETAIADMIEDIYFRIEDWKEQEEERKEREAYFEDVLGF